MKQSHGIHGLGWPAALAAILIFVSLARAQVGTFRGGTDFKFPIEYWPESNGVRRLKTLVTGAKYRPVTNGIFALTVPRIEGFREDGTTLVWTAISRDCIVDMNAKEVHGDTNMFFRTADERLFHTGVGFLWQGSDSVLTLSNKVFTWIDKKKILERPANHSTNNMKAFAVVSLVATARLTAAEMEVPPPRPGLTIHAEYSLLDLKTNSVLYSNQVVVVDPPSKPGGPETILTCVWATGRRDAAGNIDEIVAHEHVTIDQGDLHARGHRALYTGTNELLVLTGAYDINDASHPYPYLFKTLGTNISNSSTQSAVAIVYDRVNNTVSSYSNVVLYVAPAALKSITPTNSPGSTNVPARPKRSN